MDIEYNIKKRLSSDPEYGEWRFLEAINGQAKILSIVTDELQNWLRKEDYRKTVLQLRVNQLENELSRRDISIPDPPKDH